jgi:hypothetical protein
MLYVLSSVQGAVPSQWPAATFSSYVVTGNAVTSFWNPPTLAGFPYTLQQYKLFASSQEWTLWFLNAASAPVDSSAWTAMQMAGGNAVSFQQGWVVLQAFGGVWLLSHNALAGTDCHSLAY